ncbi:hypothetical protein C9374_007399 [Naegleria lovaniensis]|uniref:Copper transport protein n=1 Tax=Naegleria lovaniensis TaxID=51637 RepID=A0AA88GLV8_NAELO|nr:uncharacterized protein C9374_007399 [Naegleria lovaniensis]KAG2379260.1 hypothetical protein C9374_007399 [Naegleria lovaniensis]
MCQHTLSASDMMPQAHSGAPSLFSNVMMPSQIIVMNMGDNNNMTHHMNMYFSSESFQTFVKYVLFENWNVDTDWKFALSVIGIFLIALLNQFIFFLLHIQAPKKRKILYICVSYIAKPIGFFLEMSIGYLLMLVAMTYNFGLFMAIILGNFIGYILFNTICTQMLEGYYHQGENSESEKHACCKKREYEKIIDTEVKKYSTTGVVNFFDDEEVRTESMAINRGNNDNNEIFHQYIEGTSSSVRSYHDDY